MGAVQPQKGWQIVDTCRTGRFAHRKQPDIGKVNLLCSGGAIGRTGKSAWRTAAERRLGEPMECLPMKLHDTTRIQHQTIDHVMVAVTQGVDRRNRIEDNASFTDIPRCDNPRRGRNGTLHMLGRYWLIHIDRRIGARLAADEHRPMTVRLKAILVPPIGREGDFVNVVGDWMITEVPSADEVLTHPYLVTKGVLGVTHDFADGVQPPGCK